MQDPQQRSDLGEVESKSAALGIAGIAWDGEMGMGMATACPVLSSLL